MTRPRIEPADLPVTFDRPLRLFTYILGHSQVLFRGEADPEAGLATTLEVLFKDVGALSVRDHYRSPTLRLATAAEEERLRAEDERRWHDWRVFVLETGSGGNGHVVAGSVFWTQSPGPVGYRSLLLPDHDLPQWHPDRTPSCGPDRIFTAHPR